MWYFSEKEQQGNLLFMRKKEISLGKQDILWKYRENIAGVRSTHRLLLLQKERGKSWLNMLQSKSLCRFKVGTRSKEITPNVLSSLFLSEILGVRCICSAAATGPDWKHCALLKGSAEQPELPPVFHLSHCELSESLWPHWVTAFLWVTGRSLNCLWLGSGGGFREVRLSRGVHWKWALRVDVGVDQAGTQSLLRDCKAMRW